MLLTIMNVLEQEVYDAGPAGVRCLSAGLYSSALVTRTGDLLLW